MIMSVTPCEITGVDILIRENTFIPIEQYDGKHIDKEDGSIDAVMDLGGWLEYNGCTKIKLDSRCEAFSEEISGVPNVMTDYLVLSQGYRIDMEDYSYTMVEDEEILELVDDYRYVVSKKNQYVNRTLNRNPDEWIKIFDDDVYTVYIHND